MGYFRATKICVDHLCVYTVHAGLDATLSSNTNAASAEIKHSKQRISLVPHNLKSIFNVRLFPGLILVPIEHVFVCALEPNKKLCLCKYVCVCLC
jgi:hypothetical protein